MPFKIVRNDLTKMDVDVIVNTANRAPIYAAGTDTAVYKAAGVEELLEERRKIGFLEEGETAITPGFHLPAKYIIHAVSPRYIDSTFDEEKKLRDCYKKSLHLALEYDCKSIAFPLIATGSYNYPKEEGIRIAVDEINAFLLEHEMLVYLVVFDTRSTQLGRKLYPDLEAYIDNNYICEKSAEEYSNRNYDSALPGAFEYDSSCQAKERQVEKLRRPADILPVIRKKRYAKTVHEMDYNEYCIFQKENENAIKERITHLSDTFQEYLFYLIDRKKLTNVQVYKRACLTKKLFSKIKTNPDYHPDKSTAMRLCIGANLNLDETKDLLARAGYALSPCDKRDIIFSYFIEKEVYDMVEIDIVLEEYQLPCFIN